jgi:SAM-dependent methyltransferase
MSESQPDLSKYGSTFYRDGGDPAHQAATLILGHIRTLHDFGSMVDFGCGSGGWLRAAKDVIGKGGGVPRLLGIDGPHAKTFARCDGAQFRFENMEGRVREVGSFDLAISMEVAEHLTEARATSFILDITESSDVVLFSAAVPGQGGTNHINERWQSYWVEKFSALGYQGFDVLRRKFWTDDLLCRSPFYISNAFLYVKAQHPLGTSLSSSGIPRVQLGSGYPLDVVHPGIFYGSHFENVGPRALASQLPKAVLRAVKRRLAR